MPGPNVEGSSEGAVRHRLREKYIRAVTRRPKTVLAFWAVVIAFSVFLLPRVTKEAAVDKYLPPDHPAMQRWRETTALFDLYDPVVVLVDAQEPDGVFTPETLGLIEWLTERMTEVEGLEPEEVRSIATESRIFGTPDGIEIEPVMPEVPQTEEEAQAVRNAVFGFEPFVGTLISKDGGAAVLTARLTDRDMAGPAYRDLMALAEEAPSRGEDIHVAGEAVVGEYLADVIDRDAFRMNPLVALIVGVVLFFSYRSLRSLALPGLAALSGAVVTIGLMAWLGIPYYLMTNILPAVLLAVGVAYGLHLVGEYYERAETHPHESRTERAVRTTLRMWRPVVYTAVTDIAAFLDLALTSSMPPLRRFGMLSSFGVTVTLAFTLMAIPAALAVLPQRASPVFGKRRRHAASDLWHRTIDGMKAFVVAYPRSISIVSGALAVLAVWGALSLRVDDARVSNLSPDEPIYQAAHAINEATAGALALDVVVEADEPEDLYHPENLRRIKALQSYAETLPHVGKTLSVVDFVEEVHEALRAGDSEAARVPQSEDLVAQIFLLASMGELSAELTHYIDADYRLANVRVFSKSGYHSDIKVIHKALQDYVATEFTAPGLRARLSGRMDMYHAWMETIAADHFLGVFIGLGMVWLVVSLSFRYFWIGLYAVVPVSATLLGIYAAMGLWAIPLGVGTSAFAAVAIGLTVDFAIHVLDHMLILSREEGRPLPEAVALMYPSTGRPVLFSFLCVFLGMCVLTQSELPPVYLFAVLLAVSLVVSFLASLVLLPAMLLVFKPRFLEPHQMTETPAKTDDG